MRLARTARRLIPPLTISLAAFLDSARAQDQICDCPPAGFAGAMDEGALFAEEEPLPPAEILPRSPCVFTPHDVDPCFNLRCHLYPASPGPLFYVLAEVAPLFRDSERDPAFQALGPQATIPGTPAVPPVGNNPGTPGTPDAPGAFGPIVLNTLSLEPEFQGGLHMLVGGRITEIYRLETSFTGFQAWADQHTVRDFTVNELGSEGNLFSPFSGFGAHALDLDDDVPGDDDPIPPAVDANPNGVVGVDFNNLATLSLESSYDSVESNLLVDLPRMRNLEPSMLLGVRYNRIDERAGYLTESFEPVAVGSRVAINNAINNDMIGLQLGGRGRFVVEQFAWIDFDLRGAIYHNNIEHSLVYGQETLAGAPVAGGAFADATDVEKTSFGGDVGLTFHYLVTPNFALRLGYQAMWFTGMGLAAENIIPEGVRITTPLGGPNTLVFPPLQVSHEGELVYHGPVAGVVAMW
jgi:hypothetical protein